MKQNELPASFKALVNLWIETATKGMPPFAVERVRPEIEEHFHSAVEANIKEGLKIEEAAVRAFNQLGEAEKAKKKFLKQDYNGFFKRQKSNKILRSELNFRTGCFQFNSLSFLYICIISSPISKHILEETFYSHALFLIGVPILLEHLSLL